MKVEYHTNGNIKSEVPFLNGKRDGTSSEFYENGVLKARENWSEGVLNGIAEEHYPDGKPSKVGHFKNSLLIEMKSFYPNGKIFTIQTYDSLGQILDVQKYKEDGSRDSVAFPFVFIPDGDTVKKDTPTVLKVRMLNAIAPIYQDGALVIVSQIDTTVRPFRLIDTLSISRPSIRNEYQYVFTPVRTGNNRIYGQLRFELEDGDEVLRNFTTFSHPYFVIIE